MSHLSTLESISNLIGIPYLKADCYDLIRMFYRQTFEIELDLLQYDDPSNRVEISGLVEVEKLKFNKVSKPEFGDIVLFRSDGLPAHVGIYIDNVKFLHSREATGSVLEKYGLWKTRIVGFYRCKKQR